MLESETWSKFQLCQSLEDFEEVIELSEFQFLPPQVGDDPNFVIWVLLTVPSVPPAVLYVGLLFQIMQESLWFSALAFLKTCSLTFQFDIELAVCSTLQIS